MEGVFGVRHRVGLHKRLADREFRSDGRTRHFTMVANHVLDPGSKLAAEDWVDREVVIPQLSSFDVQHGYRAMDFLLESDELIQREVFHSVAGLLEVDLSQVVIGFAVTRGEYSDSLPGMARLQGIVALHL